MAMGQSVAMVDVIAWSDGRAGRQRLAEDARSSERRALRSRLRTEVLPGLERLADPSRDPARLIALAGAEARRLRAALERPDSPSELVSFDPAERRAREDEREWVRGHVHDTALQILEFIAGDGFGTGLSAQKIAHLAGGAARDLRRWIDGGDEAQLVPQLEQVTAEARSLCPHVRLVIGKTGPQPTAEQVSAITGAVREAVTNARKHACASQVVVRVQTADDGCTAVTVTDDGVGFDPERAASGRGLGVSGSIVGRMRRVGGHASLEPAPGGGTCVTLVTQQEARR
jgi:anti-sigma regulatory factor (Ser/Thr protein kinase)